MLSESDLHSLKLYCGSDVYSIRPWNGQSHGKGQRYYINLLDTHCLYTNDDKSARIWFTEENPLLQVDLTGKPSPHWIKNVARIHRRIEAWFKKRNVESRNKKHISSCLKTDFSKRLYNKVKKNYIHDVDELALPDEWFTSSENPDETPSSLKKPTEIFNKPCFFALLSNGNFYFADTFESLAHKISSKPSNFVSKSDRKERFLTCAYHSEEMPRKSIDELIQAFFEIKEIFEEEEKKGCDRISQNNKLRAFHFLFQEINIVSVYESIEFPRRDPKYTFDKKERFDSVLAHTPIPLKLCNGCRRSLHECRCDLINGYDRS